MQHVKNTLTGEVRYVTHTWAGWLKAYGWVSATFDEYMQHLMQKQYQRLLKAEQG